MSDVVALAATVERLVADAPDGLDEARAQGALDLLSAIESASPGGAPLHNQIDTVRRWIGALNDPTQHQRFGGARHLRGYVVTQLRLLRAAAEDYARESR